MMIRGYERFHISTILVRLAIYDIGTCDDQGMGEVCFAVHIVQGLLLHVD